MHNVLVLNWLCS